MKSILTSFTDAIKHLSIVRDLPDYFDQEEWRLAVQFVAAIWTCDTTIYHTRCEKLVKETMTNHD